MGKWCVDDTKGQYIVTKPGPKPPELTEVEKELYKFIEILEKQIERLDCGGGGAEKK